MNSIEGSLTSQAEPCCGLEHPFDSRRVRHQWWPISLKYLVIGENPGKPTSAYFYDPIPNGIDPVGVRRLLLPALADANLIVAPTLDAFKAGGFVFDHGVRCQLPSVVVTRERTKARELRPSIAGASGHLADAATLAHTVWVMGAIARAAAASQFPALDFSPRPLDPPYSVGSKFFVSQYLRPRFDDTMKIKSIVNSFRVFAYNHADARTGH